MIPEFTASGYLPPGVHTATWDELCVRFGGTAKRQILLGGLRRVTANLRDAGAPVIWLGGSFVTNKPEPGDFDGTWDPNHVSDLHELDPLLVDPHDLKNGRLKQKAKYGGELLPGTEGATGLSFQRFFQQSRDGDEIGIVRLNLRTLP